MTLQGLLQLTRQRPRTKPDGGWNPRRRESEEKSSGRGGQRAGCEKVSGNGGSWSCRHILLRRSFMQHGRTHAEAEVEFRCSSLMACVVRLWVTAGGRFETLLSAAPPPAASGAEFYMFQSVYWPVTEWFNMTSSRLTLILLQIVL